MRRELMRRWRLGLLIVALMAPAAPGSLRAQAPVAASLDLTQIAEADVREWLTTLSSDAMMGRATFTEGYGLAAGYVASELARLGVEPLGADGTYWQPVTRRSYRVTRRSSVTVEANGVTRTFAQDEHVVFPQQAGSPQTLTFSGVDFVGYGLPMSSSAAHPGRTGRLVVFLPGTPTELAGSRWPYPRALTSVAGRTAALVNAGAGAAIGLAPVPPARPATAGRGGRGGAAGVDLTTVLRVDRPRPPAFTGDETFFEFLLASSPVPFSDLRSRASRGEPLDGFTLPDVRVTIDVDHTYEIVRSEHTNNVVGLVRGSDPRLRDTYVLFGAHLDHVGMASSGSVPGRTNVPVEQDPIWNGADDDGSGSAAVLAIAKALATGPRPKRSTVFVWHAGEEEGLLGSAAMADDPVVPIDRIQAAFNLDMVGRNHNDDPAKADTVYVVGADRISTDLHNLIVDVNDGSRHPLTLDYFYNDPNDTESFYTRSDHYSYALKGIPVAFFFTGTHADYHANTDTVDKILFPKLVRITQLIYEAGFRLADSPQPLRRDNRGPRSGRGFQGRLPEH